MGNDESILDTLPRPLMTDVFLPMDGMRMNGEKDQKQILKQKLNDCQTKRAHLVQTAFNGVWSMLSPTDNITPVSRAGNFFCFSENRDLAVIGFGVSNAGDYLEDVWILDILKLQWSRLRLNGYPIPPRSGSAAIFKENTVYVFGGCRDNLFFNDFYSINVETGNVQQLHMSGSIPSARSGAVIGEYGNRIFIWGGFDGSFPSDLYSLNLGDLQWTLYPQDIAGRSGVGFTQIENLIYIFGSSKANGLICIDLSTNSVTLIPTTGAEPHPDIVNPGMVHFDKYLLLIGGKSNSDYTLLYACDLSRKRWFVFHVLPDENTVSVVDGTVTDLGLFMIPRIHSFGVCYSSKQRRVIGFLGCPMKSPPKIMVLDIAEALSVINFREDLRDRLDFNSP